MTGMVKVSSGPDNQDRSFYRILKHPHLSACLLMFGLANVVMIPIFGHGLPPITDAFAHYRWAYGFIESIREGFLYPRWIANPNNGAGSPAMIYYPPLPFYVVAAFYLVTAKTLKAMALSCWLALALSGIAMYFFARSSLSHRASMLGAALYVLAPYHLIDLYQRASLSEFWAFVWVPLLFYSLLRVSAGGGWRSVPLLAVSYSLLLLTHVLSAFAMTLVMPIYSLLITRSIRRLAKAATGLALGVGLSAIFIAPLLFENGYVRLHRIHQDKFTKTFLIESLPAAFRAEPLAPGREPEAFFQQPDFLFFEAGMAVFVLLLALSSILILKRRQTDEEGDLQFRQLRAVWVVTLLSLLMTVRLSEPLWRVIPGLPFMQFPFRWLLIASVGISLLSAASLSFLARQKGPLTVYGVVIAFLLAINLTVAAFAVAGQRRGEQAIPTEVSSLEVPEYRPRSWNYKDDPQAKLEEAVVVKGGVAGVEAIDETGARQSYVVVASTESLLGFRTLYFPGWVGRVDGEPVRLEPSEQGRIQLSVGPGKHILTLSFEDTRPRTAGKLISAFCLLATAAMVYVTRRKRFAAAA